MQVTAVADTLRRHVGRRASGAPARRGRRPRPQLMRIPFGGWNYGSSRPAEIGARRMTWLWWAPLATVSLHITEEFVCPGGFAAWDRSYRSAIRKSITSRLHIIINAALLLVCVQVGLLARSTDVEAQGVGVAAWLTIAALLFSNAVFHGIGTVRTRAYSPGVVTAIALYIPLAPLGYWYFLHNGQVAWPTATGTAVAGGSYHFWAALLHKARARRAAE
jgi:hypothetical protein